MQHSNVYTSLHNGVRMLVFCAILVPYMSSQKGEFNNYISRLCIIQLHVCLTALVLEESILLVTLVHVLSLTMNIYDKSKQNKHPLKL